MIVSLITVLILTICCTLGWFGAAAIAWVIRHLPSYRAWVEEGEPRHVITEEGARSVYGFTAEEVMRGLYMLYGGPSTVEHVARMTRMERTVEWVRAYCELEQFPDYLTCLVVERFRQEVWTLPVEWLLPAEEAPASPSAVLGASPPTPPQT